MTAQHVLLTGTGTIGREVLQALLHHTRHRVTVLMRDRRRRAGSERGRTLLDELSATPAERARVEVLTGDVTADWCGVDAAALERLRVGLDVIVHTAAETSLTADRTLCDSVNRLGTANVLRVASTCYTGGRLVRVIHLSTALVAGAASSRVVREDELPLAPAHVNHYEWSKYEAERLVRTAMRAGLPATILRPSMVVGETVTGRTRDFDVIYPLLRLMRDGYLTRFPADPHARIHLAPLDFVVEAIVRAIDAAWTTGYTFHLTAPDPPTAAQLFGSDAFFPPGVPRPSLCPPQEFEPAACGARERELLQTLSFCFPYFNSRLSFETRNAARLVPLPITDDAYLARLAQFAIASGYLRDVATPRGTDLHAIRAH